MKNNLYHIALLVTLALAMTGIYPIMAPADSQIVGNFNRDTPVEFSVSKSTPIRDVLFRLAKASLRQTGPMVTVEVASPAASIPIPPQAETSHTVADWLRLMKAYVPVLRWSSSAGAIHVVVPAPKPYDPFSTQIETNYTATMTVRQWTEWIAQALPAERLRIDDLGYGDQPALLFSTGLPDQVVRLNVMKGMTIRQFLTALAAGYDGTWVVDIQDPSIQPKRIIHVNYGPLAVRNYTYLFRANDPYLYAPNQ